MSQRKAWTPLEDKALRELYEQRGIKKWAEISRVLQKEFKIQNRSGKQCRERYHNHLDGSIKREKWSAHEEAQLIRLQEQLGNRWAEISRSIPGRSENCVKNQFYSILRRGLRKLNTIIKSRLKRYKELEIIQLSENPHNPHSPPTVPPASNNHSGLSLPACHPGISCLKKEIAYYGISEEDNDSFDLKRVKQVIEQIKEVCKGGNKRKAGGKAGVKKEVQKQSEDIQSSEYRDDVPVESKEIKELKPRRSSLYSFHLEKDEDRNDDEGIQLKNLCLSPALMPQASLLLRKTSLSNLSHEGTPRYEATSPKFYDVFGSEGQLEHTQNSFRSPSGGMIGQSPYFDQLRPNLFSSWYNFYPH